MNGAPEDRFKDQAFSIYELICNTSGDRPVAFHTMEQAQRETAAWQAANPGLQAMSTAPAEVLFAFLRNYKEWRTAAEHREDHKSSLTMGEAVLIALAQAPKPLPSGIVLQLLREFGSALSWMLCGFPLRRFLSILTREEMTDEIRAELRRMLPHYAPSATGKVDPNMEPMRARIAELMWVEGEKQLDVGRGPWSQIVFDELKQRDELSRAGWEGLLEHCRALEQTVPGAKWNKRAGEMMSALGDAEAVATLLRWLAMGPTPDQPPEATSPIEDSAYQKGVLWCLTEPMIAMSREREVASAIAEFTLACLRKIPMLGAVSQKVGFAGVQALGAMECPEAVSQLTRLRARVKYSVALKLIEKSLQQAAARSGLSPQELEDISVNGHGLDAEGAVEFALGDAIARVRLAEDGSVAVIWRNAEGKLVKAPPSHVKKAFAKEVRAVATLAKELEEAYMAQRVRLESCFVAPRSMPLRHWRQYFIDHPLLGFLGRRLIWVFSEGKTWERSAIWRDGELRDQAGEVLEMGSEIQLPAQADEINVRLWHPLASEPEEIQRWRERISSGIRQPFRQAFREFYQPSDDERRTRMYSNRFAGVYLRQHQLAGLCRARGWEYRLMGANFDGHNLPTRRLPQWDLVAELRVELPPDRDPALRDSGLGEQSGFGINLFVESDEVRFYRNRREVAVDEVPAMLYSEVMRDVDLFTSVCSIGEDENWRDRNWHEHGDRSLGVPGDRTTVQELTAVMALRGELLGLALPHTPIAARCTVAPGFLDVQGQLGRYSIQLGWGTVLMVADSAVRMLNIPQKLLAAVPLDPATLPIELDYRTESILRKAWLLADDWKIDDPGLVRQFMPK